MTDKLKELRRLVEAASLWCKHAEACGIDMKMPKSGSAAILRDLAKLDADALIEVAEAARGCRHTGQAARHGEFRMNADAMRKLWAALRKLEEL